MGICRELSCSHFLDFGARNAPEWLKHMLSDGCYGMKIQLRVGLDREQTRGAENDLI